MATNAEAAAADTKHPLAGRHAVVTGGSRGIGAACAHALAGLGASITLIGRTPETLAERAAAITEAHGVETEWEAADVPDAEALKAALADTAERLGPVTVLVNNAGGTQSATIARVTPGIWSETIALNLTAAFTASQAVLPAMVERRFGRIVNVASTAGLKGYAYVDPYCAAKHGLIGLTRAMALELARTGVTVNAVCPGFADTDMTRESVAAIAARTGAGEQDARAALEAMNPLGRLIHADEVAEAVAWLCKPSSEGITGIAVPVAGGEVM